MRTIMSAVIGIGLLATPAHATDYHVDFSDLTVGDIAPSTLSYPGVTISGGFGFLVDEGPSICAYLFSSCDGGIALDFDTPATNIRFSTLFDGAGYKGVSYGYLYQGSQFGGYSPVDGDPNTVDYHDLTGLPPITRLLLSFDGGGLGIAFDDLYFTLDGDEPPAAGVPEPSAWMTMILGLGAIGGAMRYRRRRTTVHYA